MNINMDFLLFFDILHKTKPKKKLFDGRFYDRGINGIWVSVIAENKSTLCFRQ